MGARNKSSTHPGRSFTEYREDFVDANLIGRGRTQPVHDLGTITPLFSRYIDSGTSFACTWSFQTMNCENVSAQELASPSTVALFRASKNFWFVFESGDNDSKRW